MLRRLIRIVVWVVYFGGSTFLGLTITIGVFRSARNYVGQRPTPSNTVTADDLRACSTGLDALFNELTEELRSVPVTEPGAAQDARWDLWLSKDSDAKPSWRGRLLAIGGRCRLLESNPPEAEPLREAYRKLDRLQQLYTTHVVQYAREIGKLADDTRTALKKAREAVQH